MTTIAAAEPLIQDLRDFMIDSEQVRFQRFPQSWGDEVFMTGNDRWEELDEPITLELLAIRERIDGQCLYSKASPEWFIKMALSGGVDFLDLFTYHSQALTPRARLYAQLYPEARVVYVGLESESRGSRIGNEFLINYDALELLKRMECESTGIVNADHPFLEGSVEEFLQQISRVLTTQGIASFYIPKLERQAETILYTERTAKAFGFQEIRFPPIRRIDYANRYNNSSITRVVASK